MAIFGNISVPGGGGGGVSLTDLQKLPSQRKTSGFTMDVSMAGQRVYVESATDVTIQIPTFATVPYPEDAHTEFVQAGAGRLTLVPASGVTTRFLSGTGLKTSALWDTIGVARIPGASGLTSVNQIMNYDADNVAGNIQTAIAAVPDASPANLPDLIQGTPANQPTLLIDAIGSHNAMSFDGTNDFLSFQGAALNLARARTNLTLSVILGYPVAFTGGRTLLALSSGASATSNRTTMIFRESSTNFTTAGGRALDADAAAYVNSASITATGDYVFTVEYEFVNRKLTLYKNGVQVGQSTTWQSGAVSSDTAALLGRLGNSIATDQHFGGRVYKVLGYDAVSPALRGAIHTYSQNEYGITVSDYAGVSNEWHVIGGVAT